MGIFKNLLSGGPQYIKQDLFNTVVYTAYLARFNFETFDLFWEGHIETNDGKVKTTKILSEYGSHFPRDEYLYLDWGKALIEIDKFCNEKYGINKNTYLLIKEIISISNRIHPNGSLIKSTSILGGESHPNPKIRVQECIRGFILYENMVVKKK